MSILSHCCGYASIVDDLVMEFSLNVEKGAIHMHPGRLHQRQDCSRPVPRGPFTLCHHDQVGRAIRDFEIYLT